MKEIIMDPFFLEKILIENREEREYLHKEISELWDISKKILTERQYLVFYLHYKLGINQSEIARILKISQPGVNKKIKETIIKIKKFIKKNRLKDYFIKFLD